MSDEIFAVPSYELTSFPPPSFKPWHKPRKQVVRERHWLEEYRWLSEQAGSGATISYLGLPGSDMLDVRYLCGADVAEPLDQRFLFLGFDRSAAPGSPENVRLNISERELHDLPIVDQRSRVYADEFSLLAASDSLAWRVADELGPFDLVNLDLCGSLVSEEPDLSLGSYDAIYALMGLQRHQRRPWSLLLTTRVDADQVHPEVRERLWTLFQENLDTCDEFAREVDTRFSLSVQSHEDLGECGSAEFFQVVVTSIAKWMLRYASNLHARMELVNSAGYKVYGGASHIDMASLVFRFIPEHTLPTPDPAQLASLPASVIDECEQASRLPSAVADLVNIDELLEDDELLDYYTEGSATLLELAHYPRIDYFSWLEHGGSASD